MPKRLSAKRLRITPGERRWLIAARNKLAALKGALTKRVDGLNLSFDMSRVIMRDYRNNTERLCGAAGCIKGWMGALAVADNAGADLGIKLKPRDLATEMGRVDDDWVISRSLSKLFYPVSGRPGGVRYDCVDDEIAVVAIDSFLAGNRVINWGEARRPDEERDDE